MLKHLAGTSIGAACGLPWFRCKVCNNLYAGCDMFITTACAMHLRNVSLLNCSLTSLFPILSLFCQQLEDNYNATSTLTKTALGTINGKKYQWTTRHMPVDNRHTHTHADAHTKELTSIVCVVELLVCLSLGLSICLGISPVSLPLTALVLSPFASSALSFTHSLSLAPLFHCSKLLLPHCQLLLMSF